jgi:hypothetical protein
MKTITVGVDDETYRRARLKAAMEDARVSQRRQPVRKGAGWKPIGAGIRPQMR